MAAIDDLIAQIEDKALRDRLKGEFERIAKERKFGLVFEQHLPELTPIYSAKVRKGCLVARRDSQFSTVWRVLDVSSKDALCVSRSGGEKCRVGVNDLVVVRQFGEPIFPSLIPVDAVANGAVGTPWHTLIEADNYHALQLLEYLYAGQVDCIYIDPPYNTGARDWKYNNDYVDGNDGWRHSKWLAFMERRLRLAKRLLKPDTGVLIVTIDEHEVHHLGMLLEAVFPEAARQMATIVINQKGVSQGRLARTEEYALFVFMPQAYLKTHHDDLLSPDRSAQKRFQVPRWEWLLRGGTNSRREDRPLLFYPIFIDPERKAIKGVGEPLPLDQKPDLDAFPEGTVAWPIRTDGSYGNWQVGPPSFKELIDAGFARLGGYDKKRRTWTVQYLNRGTRARIDNGEIVIVGRDERTGAVHIEYASADARLRNIKTVWHRGIHDSGIYGSSLLKSILGESSKFSFPKSLYATRDAVASVVRDRPNALIVDFFAGSGTTLNAVNLLNATDGGQRRCILVTNNEVSAEEAEGLRERGLQPGSTEWEALGICRSVTWPRSKYTVLGRRDDGTTLPGEYLTGKTVEKEKERNFIQVGFVDPAMLFSREDDSEKRRKQLAKLQKQMISLIDGLPQNLVKDPSSFIVSPEHKSSVLFDTADAKKWLETLAEQDHITDFYIVTPTKQVFDDLKAQVIELLGPLIVSEEEKRPMSFGFATNLAYFKLDFLDKDEVALGRQFREILPILWLRAGSVGPRPELAKRAGIPDMLIPEKNQFAVLVDETKFAKFVGALSRRPDITHVFLVTDSEEAFQEMATEFDGAIVVQLYRDYLENFVINKGDRS